MKWQPCPASTVTSSAEPIKPTKSGPNRTQSEISEMNSIDSDFTYMCRTCMRRDELHTEPLQLQSLYDCPLGPIGEMSIVDMLVSTTPQLVTPMPMDGLPQLMCINCLERLIEAQQFQEMCLSSERCLRGFTNGSANVDALVEENTESLEYKYSVELEEEEEEEEESRSEEIAENMNITNTELDDEELVEQVDDIIECIEIVEDPLLNDLISAEETPATIGEFTTDMEQFKIEEYATEIDVVDLDEHKEQTIAVIQNQQPRVLASGRVDDRSVLTDEHELSEMHTFEANLDDYIQVDGEITSTEPRQTSIRKNHPQTPCPICGKTFYGKYRIERHLQVHDTDGRPFACSKCEYRFITLDKLKAHETKVHNATHYEVKKTYPCNECPLVMSNESALATHKALHGAAMSSEALKYTCPLCGKYFDSNQLLNVHKRSHRRMSLMANGSSPYVCRFCNKTFQHPRTLKEHIRTHTGEQPYLCFECGKAFNSSSNMKQHLMRHTGELRYECPECPKRFPCLSDLASHKAVHNKVKRQVCDICGAAFVKPYQLKTHKMYHNGDKPHKCEYCEMRFVCADHMRRHMRTHTGEKPYKCKYCDRAFAQSNDLIKHLRSHLGENVYKCELCPSGFRLASELRKHFTQHKNDDDLTRQRNLTALLEEEARLKIKFTSSPAIAAGGTGCSNQYGRRIVSTTRSASATSNGGNSNSGQGDGVADSGVVDNCHDIASIVESIEQ